MRNLNTKWALFTIIVIALVLTTVITFASPILAVKKSSSVVLKSPIKPHLRRLVLLLRLILILEV